MTIKVAPSRSQFDNSITQKEIERLVSIPELRVLQCSKPVSSRTWDLLNSSFFSRRPDVELRVYGFGEFPCDLNFLQRMQHVRRFSADCLLQATGVEHVAALEQLESLSIGIFDLKDFEFLAQTPNSLKQLSLGATKSKKPKLDVLGRFGSLTTLYLDGQQNHIEVLAELETIEYLTLRSITTRSLDYLKPLNRLWSLDIKLGGISNLAGIEDKPAIKYLELWQIRDLSDIGVISSLVGLQYMFLQSLKHVLRIPDLSRLTQLRRVWLENLKGLEDLSALEGAPALEEFIHTSARNFAPAQYEGLLRHPRLRRMLVGFGSERKNHVLEVEMSRNGIEKYSHGAFVFH